MLYETFFLCLGKRRSHAFLRNHFLRSAPGKSETSTRSEAKIPGNPGQALGLRRKPRENPGQALGLRRKPWGNPGQALGLTRKSRRAKRAGEKIGDLPRKIWGPALETLDLPDLFLSDRPIFQITEKGFHMGYF